MFSKLGQNDDVSLVNAPSAKIRGHFSDGTARRVNKTYIKTFFYGLFYREKSPLKQFPGFQDGKIPKTPIPPNGKFSAKSITSNDL
jgi:hypothetical protein